MRTHLTPAHASVEDLGRCYDGGGEHYWRVTVWTPPGWPKPARRVYFPIRAYEDTIAAREGLRRFAEEIDGKPRLIVEP